MKYILTLAAITIFFSCASAPKALITDSDNNKKLSLKQGDIFEVRLEAQLSTGFSWQVTSIKGAEKKGDTKVVPLDKNIPGGKEIQILQFKATKRGEGEIVLYYFQPWKGKADTDKKFNVLFTIE
jgi:predicted secreted protein